MTTDELHRLLVAAEEFVPTTDWRASEDEDGMWEINVAGDGRVHAMHNHITYGALEQTHRLIVASVNNLPALLDVATAARTFRGDRTGFNRDRLDRALARLDGA